MLKPYKRIAILHVVIIASGFLLAFLKEPTAGLILLIAAKTFYDMHESRKKDNDYSPEVLTELREEHKKKIDELVENPVVKINGKEIVYKDYGEFRESSHYKLMKTVMNLTTGPLTFKLMEDYAEKRFAEKQQGPLKKSS